MLTELQNMLEDAERGAIAPVFQIRDGVIDETLSQLEPRNGFLVCRFVSEKKDRCPFELSFGRGPESGRFNFFIGGGAEFYNYESVDDEESRAAIRCDLDLFLRSAVTCEAVIGSKGVAVEHYTASKLLIDDSPVRFTLRKYSLWPFSKRETKVIDYRPWIE